MDNRPTSSYDEHRRMAMAGRSFTGSAIITLVLYFLLWLPGLIANILFYREAREVRRVTGHTPAGMGCLSVMFWLSVIPFILVFFLIIPFLFS